MYLVDSANYFCLPTLCERNTHFYLLHLAYVCIIKNIILRFSTLPERKVKNALNLRNESWKIMLEIIAAVNKAVNDFIWGVPAMVCIIGVGLLLSFRTRFLQIRKFPYAMRTTAGRMFRKKDASDGSMTPFQAVCTALAGTVGTGNIAGVAGAIAIGGPGAVFWMWCSALLGMCTKFAEVTLAVHFRERSKTGEWVGGPMYYIKNGLGRHWQFLAVLYSLFGALTVFGTGNATQVNTIVTAIDSALLATGSRYRYGADAVQCDRHGPHSHGEPRHRHFMCNARCHGAAGRHQAHRQCERKARAVYGAFVCAFGAWRGCPEHYASAGGTGIDRCWRV